MRALWDIGLPVVVGRESSGMEKSQGRAEMASRMVGVVVRRTMVVVASTYSRATLIADRVSSRTCSKLCAVAVSRKLARLPRRRHSHFFPLSPRDLPSTCIASSPISHKQRLRAHHNQGVPEACLAELQPESPSCVEVALKTCSKQIDLAAPESGATTPSPEQQLLPTISRRPQHG